MLFRSDSKLQNRMDSLERNVNKSISNDNLGTKISNIVRDELSRKILNSEQYNRVFLKNIEKLQSELELKGNSIMKSIISDESHNVLANRHLENLSEILEKKYTENANKMDFKLGDITAKIESKLRENSKYDDKIYEIKNEIETLKKRCESMESTFIATLVLFGGTLGIYFIVKLISIVVKLLLRHQSKGHVYEISTQERQNKFFPK